MTTRDGARYPTLPDVLVPDFDFSLLYTGTIPVIYGHYWFDWDNHREDWTDYTACVDVSTTSRTPTTLWPGCSRTEIPGATLAPWVSPRSPKSTFSPRYRFGAIR